MILNGLIITGTFTVLLNYKIHIAVYNFIKNELSIILYECNSNKVFNTDMSPIHVFLQ